MCGPCCQRLTKVVHDMCQTARSPTDVNHPGTQGQARLQCTFLLAGAIVTRT